MTLDPIHVDGIAALASQVRDAVDEREQTALAERAFEEFLDPLYDDEVVLRPIDELRRQAVSIADIALETPPFATRHGLDAGTINPTTFENGLVLDVSQAAMAAVPSALELHRHRTIVMTVHTNDETVSVADQGWTTDDNGYARRRVLRAPRVDRYEQTVVHALALYHAESEHALAHAGAVDDLLVLDGPVYPTGLLSWVDRDPALRRLIVEETEFAGVVENYRRLVERFVERSVPLLGFVKNTTTKAITRLLRQKTGAPWVDDAAFFRRVLERYERGDRRTDELTFTNWFRSRAGSDGLLVDGEVGGRPLRAAGTLEQGAYELTFFMIYDPRDDLLYRIEAPYAFTRDPAVRDRLRRYALCAVAAEGGPPLSIKKADELARISRDGKQALRRRIERAFDTECRTEYNDTRWGDQRSGPRQAGYSAR